MGFVALFFFFVPPPPPPLIGLSGLTPRFYLFADSLTLTHLFFGYIRTPFRVYRQFKRDIFIVTYVVPGLPYPGRFFFYKPGWALGSAGYFN
jgi:hypothetical protein